jgi:hypothetical protein
VGTGFRKAKAAEQRSAAPFSGVFTFTKAPNVLRGMGLSHLPKTKKAIEELAGKGMAPS